MTRCLPSQTWEEEGPGVPEPPCTGAAWCARGGWGHKGGFLRRGQGPRPPHSSFSLATRGHCLSFQEGGTATMGTESPRAAGLQVGDNRAAEVFGPSSDCWCLAHFWPQWTEEANRQVCPQLGRPHSSESETKAEDGLKAPPHRPDPGQGPAPPAAEMSGNRRGTGTPQVIEDSLPLPYATPRGRASPKSTNNSQTNAPPTQLCSGGSQQISHLKLSPNQKKWWPWGQRCDIG